MDEQTRVWRDGHGYVETDTGMEGRTDGHEAMKKYATPKSEGWTDNHARTYVVPMEGQTDRQTRETRTDGHEICGQTDRQKDTWCADRRINLIPMRSQGQKTYRKTDGQTDRQTERLTDGETERRKADAVACSKGRPGDAERRTDGRTDRETDGRTDRQRDGREADEVARAKGRTRDEEMENEEN